MFQNKVDQYGVESNLAVFGIVPIAYDRGMSFHGLMLGNPDVHFDSKPLH